VYSIREKQEKGTKKQSLMSTELGSHTFCAIPQLMLGSSLGLEWLVGDFCRGPMMMRHGGHFCVAPSLEPEW
jgi:hypothetical protein